MVGQDHITQQLSLSAFKKNRKIQTPVTVTFLKEQNTTCNPANTSQGPKNAH